MPLFSETDGRRARESCSGALALQLTISRWTKLVGKSGDWFKQVADRLREVNLPQEAEKYAELEKELIEYKVQGLLTEAQDK